MRQAPRDKIAEELSVYLERKVSKNMLDAYSSTAREEHVPNVAVLIGLMHVTGDTRPLQDIAAMFGHTVVDNRFVPWIEVGQLAEARDEVQREFEAAKRSARKGRC